MNRQTKIICTLGPASRSEQMLALMASKGMNVARLNFSHGSHEDHQRMIDRIRKVNKKKGFSVKILQDLEGYRIRVGYLKSPVVLKKGETVCFSAKNKKGVIPFDYEGSLKKIKKGMDVFIDDGMIHLEVRGHRPDAVMFQVVQGGILKSRKGINIPALKLAADILTEKDKNDLRFGIENQVDYVAQSFVRNAHDISRVKRIVEKSLPACRVIAKIESPQGLKNIDRIMDHCDGIMVARGDLGVSFPVYKVPVFQKYIIRRCNRKGRFVITATQMLESMTEHFRPTRAEVSDVANAILDGTNYVMLSGETAVGKYPAQCVNMMRQIIEYTEQYENPKIS